MHYYSKYICTPTFRLGTRQFQDYTFWKSRCYEFRYSLQNHSVAAVTSGSTETGYTNSASPKPRSYSMCIAIRCIFYSLYLDSISRGISVIFVMMSLSTVHVVICLITLKPWLLKIVFSCLSNKRAKIFSTLILFWRVSYQLFFLNSTILFLFQTERFQFND